MNLDVEIASEMVKLAEENKYLKERINELESQYDYECEHHRTEVNLEDLEEDVEKGRWELEMTATRTETLKLPTFEQITSNKDDIETRVVGFYVDRIYYILEYASDLDGNWRICLEKDTIEDCEYLFEAESTKENYLEACKMAKKLFLGEEV